ncbi:thioredoxin family protein [Pukyongia salina]|uniref:Thioredoxin family protein n=1 Tax=Pukyongia salina TaxID=2094025 RepID=A0A2S0HTN0_9FLAO|nr:thioredoxin family protein [Pukyongia salina]AVI50041.1 thioredoxin family protein [Pukyongia salina]
MKNSLFLGVFLFISLGIQSQNWHTDMDEAKTMASQNNQKIILVFKGSDWCAPCIKLEREVLSTEYFRTYAKEHFVLLEADFPKRKKNALPDDLQKKNNELAERYNKRGVFPFVVVLDKDGNVLGETGYFKTTPEAYVTHLESFKG